MFSYVFSTAFFNAIKAEKSAQFEQKLNSILGSCVDYINQVTQMESQVQLKGLRIYDSEDLADYQEFVMNLDKTRRQLHIKLVGSINSLHEIYTDNGFIPEWDYLLDCEDEARSTANRIAQEIVNSLWFDGTYAIDKGYDLPYLLSQERKIVDSKKIAQIVADAKFDAIYMLKRA